MNKSYYSLGLMSGTSGDGVDASLAISDGKNKPPSGAKPLRKISLKLNSKDLFLVLKYFIFFSKIQIIKQY